MDPKKIKTYLVPTVAVAALIVVIAIISIGGLDMGGTSGMSDAPPPIESEKWLSGPDGVKIWDVREGTGPVAEMGKGVVAYYTGWLAKDGTKFDSNRDAGEPMTFNLEQVVKGWQKGIPGMKVGGIRRLYLPWELAYGEKGYSAIPGKADLIFEVKLVGLK